VLFRSDAVLAGTPVEVTAESDRGTQSFEVTADIQTDSERRILTDGGLLPSVMKNMDVDTQRPVS
jgi:hypothetical protein